mmetsp:Transcript_92294/g.261286  ORF Transcript_92294/g.261286 Transcript_92294/m.261286 type:complete len:368 (+) Transcript_92294:150-1253(+)
MSASMAWPKLPPAAFKALSACSGEYPMSTSCATSSPLASPPSAAAPPCAPPGSPASLVRLSSAAPTSPPEAARAPAALSSGKPIPTSWATSSALAAAPSPAPPAGSCGGAASPPPGGASSAACMSCPAAASTSPSFSIRAADAASAEKPIDTSWLTLSSKSFWRASSSAFLAASASSAAWIRAASSSTCSRSASACAAAAASASAFLAASASSSVVSSFGRSTSPCIWASLAMIWAIAASACLGLDSASSSECPWFWTTSAVFSFETVVCVAVRLCASAWRAITTLSWPSCCSASTSGPMDPSARAGSATVPLTETMRSCFLTARSSLASFHLWNCPSVTSSQISMDRPCGAYLVFTPRLALFAALL